MNDISFGKFDFSKYRDNLVVTDPKIAELYTIFGDNVFLLPCGEDSKSFQHVEALCSWFLSKNLDKNGTVVAIGGGSVGDTVGFATSIYKRGVSVLHVPTTLIAQVDSSIGGKTAVNLCGVKNAVGSYHFGATLIDVDFLNTLDEAQMLSGYGEIIKYAMLDANVAKVLACGNGKLDDLIAACVNCKKRICELDPYCKGARNKLNFGHTIGHALELSLGISHGVAVANGIYYETLLSTKLGRCNQAYFDEWGGKITQKFKIYPLTKEILALTLHDKKNADSKVGFVLPNKFDEVLLSLDEIEGLLLDA